MASQRSRADDSVPALLSQAVDLQLDFDLMCFRLDTGQWKL